MEKAYLVLSNGMVFEGERIGARADSTGELVFTTGMCGYIETLTDPSYAGQIVMQTFPLIGNYGIIEEDFEGACAVRGYVVRECCTEPSNFRCDYDLDTFLKNRGVPGICGVDTRYITKIIRSEGVMNACICSAVPESLDELRAYAVRGAVPRVTCRERYTLPALGERRFSVALIDYGAKRSIALELQKRGCEVTVFPGTATASEILDADPDGIMLSNGPGDPAENKFCIAQLRRIIGERPVFGICLGHQLAALAMDGETVKLKYGHRGANQPVRDLTSGRTYITSQNHGYAVVSGSLRGAGRVIFENANDGTCEGVEYPGKMCFTVQFHPEARSGPHDTLFLFDRFIRMMEGGKSDAER